MWTGIVLGLAVLVIAASAVKTAIGQPAAWPMAGLMIALSLIASSIGWRLLRVLDVLHLDRIASYKAIGGATMRRHRFEILCLAGACIGLLILTLLVARSLSGGMAAGCPQESIQVNVDSAAGGSGGEERCR